MESSDDAPIECRLRARICLSSCTAVHNDPRGSAAMPWCVSSSFRFSLQDRSQPGILSCIGPSSSDSCRSISTRGASSGAPGATGLYARDAMPRTCSRSVYFCLISAFSFCRASHVSLLALGLPKRASCIGRASPASWSGTLETTSRGDNRRQLVISPEDTISAQHQHDGKHKLSAGGAILTCCVNACICPLTCSTHLSLSRSSSSCPTQPVIPAMKIFHACSRVPMLQCLSVHQSLQKGIHATLRRERRSVMCAKAGTSLRAQSR